MKAPSRYVFLAALALSAACTVHGVDVPAPSGPSELALSVAVTATPSQIPQDGASQSSIAVIARGPDGRGLSGQTFRIETALNGVPQDYGLLSTRNVLTNADGRATVIYTAPPPAAVQGGSGNILTIYATPIGSNFQAATSYSTELRLVPERVRPPAGQPTPRFSVSPTPVSTGVSATFDASGSCATEAPCGSTAGIASFAWNFGDGTSSTGQTTAHAFGAPGTYTVTLTVTNDSGGSASTTQSVSVGQSLAPTATFIVTPASPRVGQALNFNADQSKPAPGRTITQYSWNFGDGTPGKTTGFLTQHTYTAAGTYTVILSIMDDAGQKATSVQTVTVMP